MVWVRTDIGTGVGCQASAPVLGGAAVNGNREGKVSVRVRVRARVRGILWVRISVKGYCDGYLMS